MTTPEALDAIRHATDPDVLMGAIQHCIDYLDVHRPSLSSAEASEIFQAILPRIDTFPDRKETLYCMAKCTDEIESLEGVSLDSLVNLLDETDVGEASWIVEILGNSGQSKYLGC